jgi:PAS domain S-box-containing protein
VVFRAKLLAVTMTGILLVGIIPLAAIELRRGQLHDEMMQELNTLGKSECGKVAKDVYLMLRAQHEKLKKEVRYDLNVAEYIVQEAGGFSLAQNRVHWTATNQFSGRSIELDLPKAILGNQWIERNTDPAVSSPVVDKVRQLVGARCTIFQRINDAGDLLRVCTNVLKKDGTRAVGTYIPATLPDGAPDPVVAAVLQGKTYVGRAYVVDDWYLTAYEPLLDAKRKVVGALFCGVRLEDIPELRKGIVDISVGRTGYAYVLGGGGEQRGRYIISRHGLRDGENIYDSQDASGDYFIRSIIEKALQTEDGNCYFTKYAWRNPGEESPRPKVVAATYFEPWDWVIGAGAYEDDFHTAIVRVDRAASRLIFWAVIGAFMAFVLCGVLAWVESGRIAAMNHEIAERKLAEEAARSSETKYRTLFDASGEAILYARPDAGMLAGNPATIKLFGCRDEAEFISFSPADLSPEYQPDGAPSSLKAQKMMAIAMDRGSHCFEWTHRRRDGSDFLATVLLTRIELQGRTVLLTTVRDITAQKESERALRESERRLANIIDFLPDATFAIDQERRVIAWNRALEEMTGVPAAQMLGKGDYAYAAPFYGKAGPLLVDLIFRDDKGIEEHYRAVQRKGTQLIAESTMLGTCGKGSRHLWIIAAPLYDSDGCLVGAIESVRDVTDRKRAEEALRNSETRYRTVYDASLDGIMLRTPDRRILTANRAMIAIFGCKDEDELKAMSLAQMNPTCQPDGELSPQKAARMMEIAMQKGSHCFEWSYRRKDGTPFYATVALTTLTLDGKTYFQNTIRDITEQKHADEALRASETRYKTLYDASSDAILLRTPDRRIISGNRAAVALFGCKDEAELLALTPADMYTEYQPDGRLSSEKAPLMAEIALREGSYSFEWRYKRKDGTGFLANVLWTRMELEGKQILLTTIRDITEQRRAEEALRASERSYRLLADNLRDVVGTMDFSGRVTYISPSIEQLLGYTVAEMMPMPIDSIISPASLALMQAFFDKAAAAAQTGERIPGATLELELIRKDGSTVMAEAVLSGMYDESGRVTAIQGVTRDITSRKQAEEERALATRRMESLLALSHMADKPMEEIIATVVEDGIRMTRSAIGFLALTNDDESVLTVRYWSKSAHATCGVRDQPIVYSLETTGLWGEAVRQRQPIVANDYAAPNPLKRGTPEGHLPIVRYMGIPVFDGQRIVAVAGVANKPTDYDERDLRQLQLLMEGWWRIAKQKDYELNLALARDEAQAANRAKSRFLATMSHEIRTPMTAILGYADLLMDPTIDPSVRLQYVTTIRRSGEHLLELINDILDLSKIEAGKMSLSMGQCSLTSLLADVASVVRPRAEQRGIALSIEYSGAIPESIQTDRARLRQTIINLAGNAVKFTEKGSVRIIVSFLPDGCNGAPAVQIDVIDTGVGIAKDVLPHLFRPFSQGDPSIAQKFGGTGLGLAISRQLAQMLGGNLNVASQLGRGSTFTLVVPTGNLDGIPMLQDPSEAVLEDKERTWSAESHDLTGVRVLLAEDGFDNRELLRVILQRAGVDVEMAINGCVAVQKACEKPFDLILMDMNMPEMDGYEATRLLRDRGYVGPIVALTANAMVGDCERCRDVGCNEYLAKPIDRRRLIQTIASFVDMKAVAARTAVLRKMAGSMPRAASEAAERTNKSQPPPHKARQTAAPGRAAPSDQDQAPTDQEHVLISAYCDDPELASLIHPFVNRLAGQLAEMRQMLCGHKHEELRRLAHRLKGAGGSYGYQQLTDAGKSLEEAAQAQDDAAEAAALDVVASVIHAVERGCACQPA